MSAEETTVNTLIDPVATLAKCDSTACTQLVISRRHHEITNQTLYFERNSAGFAGTSIALHCGDSETRSHDD